MKKDILKKVAYLLIFFAVVTVICYYFPYSQDDWVWGKEIGLDRLNSWFKDYNGRYAGNLFVLTLTRNRYVRALCMSIFYCLIIYALAKFVNQKSFTFVGLFALIFFLMPKELLAQAVVWTSGFSNYVPPFLMVIVYLNYLKPYFENKFPKDNIILAIIFLLTGFVSCLFIENITIYLCFISIIVVIYSLIRFKKVPMVSLLFMVGAIAGTAYMFSNGAYHAIVAGTDAYREVPALDNLLSKIYNSLLSGFTYYLLKMNGILNVALCGICFYITTKSNKKDQKIKILQFVLLAGANYFFITSIMGYELGLAEKVLRYVELSIYVLYALSVIFTIIFCVKDSTIQFRTLFEIFSIAVMSGPLLMVSPIGPRCFFSTYLMFGLILCELINYQIKNLDSFEDYFLLVSLFVVFILFSMFKKVYATDQKRIAYIGYFNQHPEEVVYLPDYPYEDYLYRTSPDDTVFINTFKHFYGIGEERELYFTEYYE